MTKARSNSTLISLLSIDRFVEATRDSGYRGTGSAVSELVDNAIQAGAKQIHITLQHDHENGNDIVISVRDNGCGMDPFTLRQALQFGGSSRFNDRSGLGRYGMGLPNSSFSQARRVTVYSWQHGKKQRNGLSSVYTTGLDLDAITRGDSDSIPKPKIDRRPPSVCKGGSGTLVMWSHCDRLDFRRISTLTNKLHEELGRRFRYFLWRGVRIRVNRQLVQPIDPLFINTDAVYSGAKPYGKPLRYEVSTNPTRSDAPTGNVTVRFSELPVKRWRSLSNDQKRELGISKGAGISILRAGREVDAGWFFMGGKRKENYDDWWRCEVEFDPVLDEAFGITHTKQQVHPGAHLLKVLTADMEAIAHSLNSRARNAHRQVSSTPPPSQSEQVASSCEALLEPLPARQSPTAQKKLQRLRRKRKITATGNKTFEYRIIPTQSASTTFIDYGVSKQLLALAINEGHPFFLEMKKLQRVLPSTRYKQIETLVELLLLSAVRSEASEKNQSRQEVIETFRKRWSDTLATFINR